ncbi:hypothetical protein ACLOJK_027027 [Asimina triloba]
MFALSLIEHKLTLPPHLLDISLENGVKKELERLFLDKVIATSGLCISIYDIQDIGGGFVVAGEGAPTYEVTFRLVMFRPFVGEILVGKIEKSSSEGLQVKILKIRFRVESIKYPPIPIEQAKDAKPFAPMEITKGNEEKLDKGRSIH